MGAGGARTSGHLRPGSVSVNSCSRQRQRHASAGFADLCSKLGVTGSRIALGTSADNTASESLNATLKPETLQGRKRRNGAGDPRAVFQIAVTALHLTYARLGDIPSTYGGEIAAAKARASAGNTTRWTKDTLLPHHRRSDTHLAGAGKLRAPRPARRPMRSHYDL